MDSLDSSLMSEELSIEIDDDLQMYYTEGMESPGDAEKENVPSKFKPLRIADVKLDVSSEFKIRNLTSTARLLLADHLDLIPIGSLKTWRNLAECLGAGNDVIMSIAKNNKPTLTLLERFGETKAENLILALENIYRIDTLYSLRCLLKENNLFKSRPKEVDNVSQNLNSSTYSNASTVPQPLPSSSKTLEQINTGEPEILIIHCETNKEEIKKYKWVKRNLDTAAEYAIVKKKLVEFQSIISEEDVWISIEKGFNRAEHIIFCFNPSLIALSKKEEGASGYEKHIKHALKLAVTEHGNSPSKSRRFKPIYFPDLNPKRPIIAAWVGDTLFYEFPNQFNTLIERLFK